MSKSLNFFIMSENANNVNNSVQYRPSNQPKNAMVGKRFFQPVSQTVCHCNTNQPTKNLVKE